MTPIEKRNLRNEVYNFLKNCKKNYRLPVRAFAEAGNINIYTMQNFLTTNKNTFGDEKILYIKQMIDFFYSVEQFFLDKDTRLKENKELFLQLWHGQKQQI